MSGGSLNYVYIRVEDAAREIAERRDSPLHRAFSQHLVKVAQALHDVEWVLSADYSPGRDEAAMRAVLHEGAELGASIERAEAILEELRIEINRAREQKGR